MEARQQVVMLHGWLGAPQHFCHQQKFLSSRYDVIVPDWFKQFEHQFSSKDNLVHQAGSCLVKYFKENNIHQPILIGHSMGGVLVLDIVSRLKFPIKSAVILDTSITPTSAGIERYQGVVNELLENIDNKKMLFDFFMKTFVSAFDDQKLMQQTAREAVDRVNLVWLNLLKDAIGIDFNKYIAACSAPFLYIGSSATFADFATIKSLNPKALTAQVVASGHFVMQNATDQVNAMLARFLTIRI